MAAPVDFTGTNTRMLPPKGREDVVEVKAFRNRACCVTCWQLSDDERAEVSRTGLVYLSVFMGGGMPPVFVGSEADVRAITADFGGTFPPQEKPRD